MSVKIQKGGKRPDDDSMLTTTERIARERNRERKAEEKAPPVIVSPLNLRGATSALERNLLKTGAQRRAGRLGFYDTMRGIRRSGTGAEAQMRGVSAEAGGNRRGPAFDMPLEQRRQTTARQLAGQLRERAVREAELVEQDRAAREEYERAVVAAYRARAANMDAQARAFLKKEIFDNLGIVVDDIAIPGIQAAQQQGVTQ